MADEDNNIFTDSKQRVLARKYRPLNFKKLIGQHSLVKTLSGSIERNRLAHAYILTGIRGVGKTLPQELLQNYLIVLILKKFQRFQ